MTSSNKQVLILSVPYCEPYPMVAPVLLASCLTENSIPAVGVDLSALFVLRFMHEPWWPDFKNFLVIGQVSRQQFNLAIYRQIIKWTKNTLKELIDKHNPSSIGLSIFSSESLDFGLILSYLLRKHWPNIKLIAGGKGLEVMGPELTYHYDSWINNSVVDLIIVGDAESEIINSIKQDKTGLVFAQLQHKEDLDNIPMAQWHDYDLSVYNSISPLATNAGQEAYLSVTASKGCVRQCTFCDVASFWPDYLYREPSKVVDEIIHNYRATGIKNFRFTDNLINGSITNYREMNTLLVKRVPQTIRYRGYAIFRGKHQMPKDDFKLAQEAGCESWSVGVETGSERLRYEMKKKFDNDDLDWSVNMLYQHNIVQVWLLMVGYPSETDQDFVETKKLLTRYAKFARNGLITIQITPTFMLLNNSPLITNADLAHEYGLGHIKNDDALTNKFWTSTKFLDNTFPVRSQRWKELTQLSEDLGYQFGSNMPVKKWVDEVTSLDRIYAEQKTKVINIRQV